MSVCEHDPHCPGPGTQQHASAMKSLTEEKLLRADTIRRRYQRPRKVRLRQFRARRMAQAIGANPATAPATVKRWTR